MPGVDGGFVLTDVLSAEECNELRKATEQIGAFLEDGVGWTLFGKSRKIMKYLEKIRCTQKPKSVENLMWATAKTREDQFNNDGLKMVPDIPVQK